MLNKQWLPWLPRDVISECSQKNKFDLGTLKRCKDLDQIKIIKKYFKYT